MAGAHEMFCLLIPGNQAIQMRADFVQRKNPLKMCIRDSCTTGSKAGVGVAVDAGLR